jgi:hypothetical protein
MKLEILRDLKYIGLCKICNGALWVDSYFRVYKNGSSTHICENDKIYHSIKKSLEV